MLLTWREKIKLYVRHIQNSLKHSKILIAALLQYGLSELKFVLLQPERWYRYPRTVHPVVLPWWIWILLDELQLSFSWFCSLCSFLKKVRSSLFWSLFTKFGWTFCGSFALGRHLSQAALLCNDTDMRTPPCMNLLSFSTNIIALLSTGVYF